MYLGISVDEYLWIEVLEFPVGWRKARWFQWDTNEKSSWCFHRQEPIPGAVIILSSRENTVHACNFTSISQRFPKSSMTAWICVCPANDTGISISIWRTFMGGFGSDAFVLAVSRPTPIFSQALLKGRGWGILELP